MKKLILFTLPLIMLAACVGSNKEKREKMQAAYKSTITDSIKSTEREIDSCQNRVARLNTEISRLINNFAVVDNPREVEGYYILKGWQKRYPLTSTGMEARITLSEQLELIAANTSTTFDAVTVKAGEDAATTATVPHDQALNYRSGGLTTVMFSGSEADVVAQLIADNALNPITLIYLEGGHPKASVKLNDGEKKMIAETYIFYARRQHLSKLERQIPMLHQKINILRRHQNNE